jgi:hypothetical protein
MNHDVLVFSYGALCATIVVFLGLATLALSAVDTNEWRGHRPRFQPTTPARDAKYVLDSEDIQKAIVTSVVSDANGKWSLMWQFKLGHEVDGRVGVRIVGVEIRPVGETDTEASS